MTRVLQTRQVGLTTHVSGHVMAPPDIVYEVKEAPRRRPSWLQKGVALFGVIGCAWLAFILALKLTTGISL